jgi:alkylation response protein AidB-like acyl-CoA dehydrogenase
MIADMTAAVESARMLTYNAASMLDAGGGENAEAHPAMAKFLASDTAMKVTTDAVQILGGYGYMKDYQVERMIIALHFLGRFADDHILFRHLGQQGRVRTLPRP